MRVITGILIFMALVVSGIMIYMTAPNTNNSVWTVFTEAVGLSDPIVQPRSWGDWIYSFQSLLGGTFALIAATVTVAQMYMTDREAERRHREVMRRQNEAAEVRAERFLNPAYEELCGQEDRINYLIPRIHRDFSADFQGTANILDTLRSILQRPQFRSAGDLLDGRAAAGLNQVSLALPLASEEYSRLFNAVRNGQGNQARANAELAIQFREITVGLGELIAGLERVAARHAMGLQRPRNNFVDNNNDVSVISIATHR